MDYIFLVDEGARAAFLQGILHSLRCTYICLWSYLPQPSQWLIFMDGFYNEENINQPSSSSSSGSHARTLFNEYRQSVLSVQNDRVPGLAFKNSLPFMELKELDLQRLASVEPQLQFYQEARIKTAIFMACMTGEIELGFSNDHTHVNLEMEMRKWIPENFSARHVDLPPPPDHQNRPSSSSSSLLSLSTDSPEPSPFGLFNIPNTRNRYPPPQEPTNQPPIEQQAVRPMVLSPLHQAIQSFNQTRNFPFLSPETEDDAITKAILAVLSSSSPSHSPSSSQQNVAPNYPFITQKASAFKRYRSGLAHCAPMIAPRVGRPNMLKKAISYFKSLSLMRNNQERVKGSRPTINQLHHMISERKRREKLNESFQALRSLLPPGTKKDKGSVLSVTTEYLNSLRSKVMELTRRNQILEAQKLHETEEANEVEVIESSSSSSSYRRLNVRVTDTAESSSSEGRIVDLHVVVSGECDILDLLIKMLDFLKKDQSVSLICVEADTKVVESSSVNRVVLRLKIQGDEWDDSAFQEAVRRVAAADVAK